MTIIPLPSRTRRQTALAASLMTSVSVAVLLAPGCRSAPISGRQQLVLIPEAQEIDLGVQAYEQKMAEEPPSQNAEITAMVERVGHRIASVAGKPEYDWEFRVIAKDVQNAFALPGGKVAIYEGILPVCQSEAGLAVVMAHEIAHALARHGGERMSQEAAVNGVGSMIDAVSRKQADEATTQKIMDVYGVTSQYGVVLPFSRKHESEADAIGLILMARAGYDPSVAPEFWERFSAGSGPKPPEWLSTHPADARRAADLRQLLPEAMKYYEVAKEQYGMGESIPVAHLAVAAPRQQPARTSAAVQQVSGEQRPIPQTYGSMSALTSRHSVKKGAVAHAHHTETAGEGESEEQTAGFEVAAPASATADFRPPIKTDGEIVDPAPLEVNDGWSTPRSTDPFVNETP
jgi:metalloendopeptidase OMA1, mitochondrial